MDIRGYIKPPPHGTTRKEATINTPTTRPEPFDIIKLEPGKGLYTEPDPLPAFGLYQRLDTTLDPNGPVHLVLIGLGPDDVMAYSGTLPLLVPDYDDPELLDHEDDIVALYFSDITWMLGEGELTLNDLKWLTQTALRLDRTRYHSWLRGINHEREQQRLRQEFRNQQTEPEL